MAESLLVSKACFRAVFRASHMPPCMCAVHSDDRMITPAAQRGLAFPFHTAMAPWFLLRTVTALV